MKFLRVAQLELSRPPAEPWNFKADIEDVTVHIQPRRPDDSPRRRLLVYAEVPLDSRPNTDNDGKILIPDAIIRRSEHAIEQMADLTAVATFSTRTITSAVPTAGFSGVTESDQRWLATCSGISQQSQRPRLALPAILITDPALQALADRRDGAALLAEALADNHETGRFRELVRFFERAFSLATASLVGPLADFLGYYDKLEYSRVEVEHWHKLRNQASHADDRRRQYVLSRDVRPVLMRAELAAYDVLFNKLNWNQRDSARRDIWRPAGGMLPGERRAVIRASESVRMEAEILLDGFGGYPRDRTCRVGSHPPDWWLDDTFKAAGQMAIDSVISLHTETG